MNPLTNLKILHLNALAVLLFLILPISAFAETINLRDPEFWKRYEDSCYRKQLSDPSSSSTPKETLQIYCTCLTNELKKKMTPASLNSKEVFNVIVGNAAKECMSQMHPPAKQSIEQELKSLSNEANKTLPATLDKFTRQDSTMAGPGRRMTYFYTLTQQHASAVDIDPQTLKEVKETLRQSILASYCSDPGVEFYRKNRVALTYNYRNIKGAQITQFDVSFKDCVK